MNWAIGFSVLYVIVYVLALELQASMTVVYLLFFFSPFPLIWMVIRILKDDYHSEKTFEEYFYEDKDWRRSGKS